jgi:hypothetical protein
MLPPAPIPQASPALAALSQSQSMQSSNPSLQGHSATPSGVLPEALAAPPSPAVRVLAWVWVWGLCVRVCVGVLLDVSFSDITNLIRLSTTFQINLTIYCN